MRKKKSIIIGAGITAVLAVVVIMGGIYYSGRIKSEIAGMLQNYNVIEVDLLGQSIHVEGLVFEQAETRIQALEVSLKGLDYWNYILNNRLVINKVEVRSPDITIVSAKENGRDTSKSFKKSITVKEFQALDGIFKLKKKPAAGNDLYIRFPKISVFRVKIDATTKDQPLPFKFDSYRINGDSTAVKMNPEHFIAAEEFSLQNGKTSIKNFRIIPYEQKPVFDRSIPYEKDRISLRVDSIELDSLTFSFKNDTLHLKNPSMTISGANLEIYRNKLLEDDPRMKTLLSHKMRNSPVKFDLDKIHVKNGQITYEEKVKEDTPLATVFFTGIEGSVENFINTRLERNNFPKTSITANALLMGSSPVEMDWSFNASNTEDEFLMSGNFGTVEGSSLDPLLKPSLGMEAEGNIDSVFFTFSGNEDASTGDVRVTYDRFKLHVMRQEGQKKNKLLSALVNLFVDNDGLSEQRTHTVKVTRDKTRSFWNYIWENLKKGVIDALSQL